MKIRVNEDSWHAVEKACRERIAELREHLESETYEHSVAQDASRRGEIKGLRMVLALADEEKQQ